MIELLQSGKRIINIDESWLSSGQYHRRMWAPTDMPATAIEKQVSPRLALIASLDSDGRIFFSLTHANTDSDIMVMFISCLCRKLDAELVDWKSNSVFLLDNAKYHVSDDCRQFFKMLGVEIILSGPYSYGKYASFTLS